MEEFKYVYLFHTSLSLKRNGKTCTIMFQLTDILHAETSVFKKEIILRTKYPGINILCGHLGNVFKALEIDPEFRSSF